MGSDMNPETNQNAEDAAMEKAEAHASEVFHRTTGAWINASWRERRDSFLSGVEWQKARAALPSTNEGRGSLIADMERQIWSWSERAIKAEAQLAAHPTAEGREEADPLTCVHGVYIKEPCDKCEAGEKSLEDCEFPNYVWVGFNEDGEPKQVHPVKPHGDLVGFTWEMFFPARFCREQLAAKDLVLSEVEVRLQKSEALRDETIERHWQLAVKYDALADKYGTALQTIRERKG
jgi:hypothetical protein